jgi:CRISPR/Cas system type I-B associated protein Csh2 (Cas7 group RAMP superfamily)
MTLSDSELIAIGLQVQEARRKGGRTVYKMYGKEHFSKLGKISAEKKKALKNEAKLGA